MKAFLIDTSDDQSFRRDVVQVLESLEARIEELADTQNGGELENQLQHVDTALDDIAGNVGDMERDLSDLRRTVEALREVAVA